MKTNNRHFSQNAPFDRDWPKRIQRQTVRAADFHIFTLRRLCDWANINFGLKIHFLMNDNYKLNWKIFIWQQKCVMMFELDAVFWSVGFDEEWIELSSTRYEPASSSVFLKDKIALLAIKSPKHSHPGPPLTPHVLSELSLCHKTHTSAIWNSKARLFSKIIILVFVNLPNWNVMKKFLFACF